MTPELIEVIDRSEIELPFSRDVSVSVRNGFMAHIEDVNKRVEERKEQFAALGEIGDAPIEAVKTLLSSVKEDDETILNYCTKVYECFSKLFRFDAFVTQTSAKKGRTFDPLCSRGKLREMAKILQARVDSEKVNEPKHTYVMQFEVTDSDLKKIVSAVTKATDKWRYAVPQGDKGMKQAEKFFADNI